MAPVQKSDNSLQLSLPNRLTGVQRLLSVIMES
jgi:hypothetical protein